MNARFSLVGKEGWLDSSQACCYYLVKREWIKVVELSVRGMKVSYVWRDSLQSIVVGCLRLWGISSSAVGVQQKLGSPALCWYF